LNLTTGTSSTPKCGKSGAPKKTWSARAIPVFCRRYALKSCDATRDWGHAKDYVRMQWMMLQQDTPQDFVIATGVQHSVRDFIEWTARELGMPLRWEGSGVDTVGYSGTQALVRIDPRYFRPTEVETLLGEPSKAKRELGWVPEITAQQMCSEMVAHDLADVKKHALLKTLGY